MPVHRAVRLPRCYSAGSYKCSIRSRVACRLQQRRVSPRNVHITSIHDWVIDRCGRWTVIAETSAASGWWSMPLTSFPKIPTSANRPCFAILSGFYRPGQPKHRIAFVERDRGQLFCVDRARQILDLLVSEYTQAGVSFSLDTRIEKLERPGESITIYLLPDLDRPEVLKAQQKQHPQRQAKSVPASWLPKRVVTAEPTGPCRSFPAAAFPPAVQGH